MMQGVLSIKGLGIIPEERKNIEELPQKIKLLQKENRIAISPHQTARQKGLKTY